LLASSDAISDGLASVSHAGALGKMECELCDAVIEIRLVEGFECFAYLLVVLTALELGNLIVNDVAQKRMGEPVGIRVVLGILNQPSRDRGLELLKNFRDRDSELSREQYRREVAADHGRDG
jgi:hypothetical protein